ncbi:(2Fe-2S)-binding protein [Wenzhouxiangella sediminis]|uniref:Bacterioferritin-associated ferredoxin n=1 Tax=Wenzhouxiangella sediminis TaxID=1792836 RepID=A0A3E1KC23_9GAMM|nr:bacterioferritin-associated ferredoxin [Wenzhouxiangella sediminis]RFF32049.1 (2Fe-2S)-binding protein [Wenzhouxiangella sediminis]
MYVCVCNAVTERTIRNLVAEGYHTLDEIQALTGCSGSCGRCRDHAEAVIEASLARPVRPSLPVVDPSNDFPLLNTA